MDFISIKFLLFFIPVLILSTFLKSSKTVRFYKYFIALVSIVFYAFFGLGHLLTLILSICINYLGISLLYRFKKRKKTILIFFIILNILYLFTFKYSSFLISTYLGISKVETLPFGILPTDIIIPIGISFYTFRVISHLVESYRNKVTKPDFFSYFCYVSFFPQIISGPIERPDRFYNSLSSPIQIENIKDKSFILIIIGIFKKLVLASFFYDFVQGPFATPSNYSQYDLIITAISYTCMLYLDFSGYSDISIGISRILGFDTPKNFDHPLSAMGFKDFWNRWHISLSTWLRDYVYIPLGGNKKGRLRKYLNTLITFLISGIWHGAGLQYSIWGGLNGILSVLTDVVKNIRTKVLSNIKISDNSVAILRALYKTLGTILTFALVTFTFIFFNSKSLTDAISYIKEMFTSTISDNKYWDPRLLFAIWLTIRSNFIQDSTISKIYGIYKKTPTVIIIILLALLIYLVISLSPSTVPPFIYFKF